MTRKKCAIRRHNVPSKCTAALETTIYQLQNLLMLTSSSSTQVPTNKDACQVGHLPHHKITRGWCATPGRECGNVRLLVLQEILFEQGGVTQRDSGAPQLPPSLLT